MDLRRSGRLFGWLFIGTFVTSIPARLLFINGVGASWADMRFVPGATSTATLKWAAVLEFGLVVTQIGTAVVLYPVARRVQETLAIGYLGARTIESVFTTIGLVSMLSVVSIAATSGGPTGGTGTALSAQADSLVHSYEWAFEWGPGLVAGIGNGVILGYLMYRSGLVPRRMALLGLVGGPLLMVNFVLILSGVYKNGDGPSGLLTIPEAAWELSLGIYCAWRGFRPTSPSAAPYPAERVTFTATVPLPPLSTPANLRRTSTR